MITKAEAAAAIRATTAPGKERARLLNFVDELTDDQLHQWLIQAEDGHETIVDFITQKADRKFHGRGEGCGAVEGAAADLGVGRAGAATQSTAPLLNPHGPVAPAPGLKDRALALLIASAAVLIVLLGVAFVVKRANNNDKLHLLVGTYADIGLIIFGVVFQVVGPLMKAWLEPYTILAIVNGLLALLHNNRSLEDGSRWTTLLAAPLVFLVVGFGWGIVYWIHADDHGK